MLALICVPRAILNFCKPMLNENIIFDMFLVLLDPNPSFELCNSCPFKLNTYSACLL